MVFTLEYTYSAFLTLFFDRLLAWPLLDARVRPFLPEDAPPNCASVGWQLLFSSVSP